MIDTGLALYLTGLLFFIPTGMERAFSLPVKLFILLIVVPMMFGGERFAAAGIAQWGGAIFVALVLTLALLVLLYCLGGLFDQFLSLANLLGASLTDSQATGIARFLYLATFVQVFVVAYNALLVGGTIDEHTAFVQDALLLVQSQAGQILISLSVISLVYYFSVGLFGRYFPKILFILALSAGLPLFILKTLENLSVKVQF